MSILIKILSSSSLSTYCRVKSKYKLDTNDSTSNNIKKNSQTIPLIILYVNVICKSVQIISDGDGAYSNFKLFPR